MTRRPLPAPRRALAYDHGPGRADEHTNPRKVAGNVAGRDWRIRAHHMQRFVSAHQQDAGDRGVYRIALANLTADRVLSDGEWGQPPVPPGDASQA